MKTKTAKSDAWRKIFRILLKMMSLYAGVLGVVAWRLSMTVPSPRRGAFWIFALALRVGTMALLVLMRRVVLTHFVRPLRRRADYDALTGIYRPEVFWQHADLLTRTLTACGRRWVFVYCDLDASSRSMIRRAI